MFKCLKERRKLKVIIIEKNIYGAKSLLEAVVCDLKPLLFTLFVCVLSFFLTDQYLVNLIKLLEFFFYSDNSGTHEF